MIYYSDSEQKTFETGVSLAQNVKPGDIFLVKGSLGAGKSVLIRGIACGLGIEEAMPSPTFTLVNEYYIQLNGAPVTLYHFDFYRLNDPYELYEIGFEDYIYSNGISFIEWPSKAGDLAPSDAITINITLDEKQERKIEVTWNR